MGELTWPDLLGPLFAAQPITTEQAAWAMERIMEGEATPAQFGAFVGALRAKGETVEEIVGLVTTMRRFAQKVEVEGPLVDTCGTGGDRAGTINVSTIAALVVAGAGGRVAKHGNRAASSFCGSADVLEELGVAIGAGPGLVGACIEDAGIGFCFAQVFHPSMRHAAPSRKDIGVATIFNVLGPLSNPAGARNQALGVADPALAPKLADALERLAADHVLVFHGSGIDEISTSGPTDLWELKDGRVTASKIDAAEFGISRAAIDAVRGGTATENAKVALEVLSGTPGPARDIVLINAAAGLIAAGIAPGFSEGIERAGESIDSGGARRALDRLVEVSNRGS